MRSRLAAFSLIFVSLGAVARGQSKPAAHVSFLSHTEAALTFSYIHSETTGYNTGASYFALGGIAATAAYRFRPHLSAVVDFDGTHVNGVASTGQSLTLLTSSGGVRYSIHPRFHVNPYAEVLVGEVHATGSIYPANAITTGGADSVAFTAGGGADYVLSRVVALRVQADYLYTGLGNGSTNRQNDLRLGAGFVFHFGSR